MSEKDLNVTSLEMIMNNVRNAMNPPLKGFEKVLGRKPQCKQCEYYDQDYDAFCNDHQVYECDMGVKTDENASMWNCKYGIEQIKAEIKLKDREIKETKIDTHPRHILTQNGFYINSTELEIIL